MSTTSIAHAYAVAQAVTSWIDDPFDLRGTIAGVASMYNYNTPTRNLTNYAEELVTIYATYIADDEGYVLRLNDLPDTAQDELCRLYIESTNRETNECIYGDDFTINSEFNCALLDMLANDCLETRERFAYITRRNILTYYHDALQEILDTACDVVIIAADDDNQQQYAADEYEPVIIRSVR
jgi:hypothetical protein